MNGTDVARTMTTNKILSVGIGAVVLLRATRGTRVLASGLLALLMAFAGIPASGAAAAAKTCWVTPNPGQLQTSDVWSGTIPNQFLSFDFDDEKITKAKAIVKVEGTDGLVTRKQVTTIDFKTGGHGGYFASGSFPLAIGDWGWVKVYDTATVTLKTDKGKMKCGTVALIRS